MFEQLWLCWLIGFIAQLQCATCMQPVYYHFNSCCCKGDGPDLAYSHTPGGLSYDLERVTLEGVRSIPPYRTFRSPNMQNENFYVLLCVHLHLYRAPELKMGISNDFDSRLSSEQDSLV
jgi:hypothetical protein